MIMIGSHRIGNVNVESFPGRKRRCDRCQEWKTIDTLREGTRNGRFFQIIERPLPSGLNDTEVHEKPTKERIMYCENCIAESRDYTPQRIEIPKIEIQDLYLSKESRKTHDPAKDLPIVVDLERIARAY